MASVGKSVGRNPVYLKGSDPLRQPNSYSITISLRYDITREQYQHFNDWIVGNTVCGASGMEQRPGDGTWHIHAGVVLHAPDDHLPRRLRTAFKLWDGIESKNAVEVKKCKGEHVLAGACSYAQKDRLFTFTHRIDPEYIKRGDKLRQTKIDEREEKGKEEKLSIHTFAWTLIKYARKHKLRDPDEAIAHMFNKGHFNWSYICGKVSRPYIEMMFKKHVENYEYDSHDVWALVARKDY